MPKKKKARKIFGIIALSLVALFVLSIIINSITTHNNRKKIEDAYGEYYETSSGKMNYTIIGEGDTSIVILPGQGSISPHYEFLEIANRMSDDYKIIIIEPLGYGLSDDTNVERSAENVCNEIHEVLAFIGENQYYIMGHSIAGLYALQYANMYEDELLGFIGLDASIPAQISDESVSSKAMLLYPYKLFLVDTGVLRLSLMGIESAPDVLFDKPELQGTIMQCFRNLDSDNRTVLAELYVSRAQNRTMINEVSMFDRNANNEKTLSFPESVPVLYILSDESVEDSPNWLEYHEELASNNPNSQVMVVDGNHYVHLSSEDEVIDITMDWMSCYTRTFQ